MKLGMYIAAGMPWFFTLFGRDLLIVSYFGLGCVGPRVTQEAVPLLAAEQGTKVDDFTDEEPSEILHEIRSGELTRLGVKPHDPYDGTADVIQLWLILLAEYWRWTGDDEFIRGLRDNELFST